MKTLRACGIFLVLVVAFTATGDMTVTIPRKDYSLTISTVRPTGFRVTEHSYDAQGKLVP